MAQERDEADQKEQKACAVLHPYARLLQHTSTMHCVRLQKQRKKEKGQQRAKERQAAQAAQHTQAARHTQAGHTQAAEREAEHQGWVLPQHLTAQLQHVCAVSTSG